MTRKPKSSRNRLTWDELVAEAKNLGVNTVVDVPDMCLRESLSLKAQMDYYQEVFKFPDISKIYFVEKFNGGQGYGEPSYSIPFMYVKEKVDILNCPNHQETFDLLDLVVWDHKVRVLDEKRKEEEKLKTKKKEIELLKTLKKKYPNEG